MEDKTKGAAGIGLLLFAGKPKENGLSYFRAMGIWRQAFMMSYSSS